MTKEDVIEILERFVLGAKPCSQREIVDACASAYRMLKEQPSLPSDLDEAADHYEQTKATELACKYGWGEDAIKKQCFIAGAEWMAGQGINAEGEVCKLAERAWVTPIDEKQLQCDLYDNFVAGDKVIVQIRKSINPAKA